MGFTHDHAFVAAAVPAVVEIGALSSAAPCGVPGDPPENHSLEDCLDAWREQFLACGSISAPRKLAGFTADARSLMNATYHAVTSRPESPAAAHLTGQMARCQTERHICILEKKTLAGAVP